MDTFAHTKAAVGIIILKKNLFLLCVELQLQWKRTAVSAQFLPFSGGIFFLFVTIVERII